MKQPEQKMNENVLLESMAHFDKLDRCVSIAEGKKIAWAYYKTTSNRIVRCYPDEARFIVVHGDTDVKVRLSKRLSRKAAVNLAYIWGWRNPKIK